MKTLVMSIVLAMLSVVCHGAIIHVPGDQPTIQAGIDSASQGDTILLADGIYTGDGNRDIDFMGKEITVMSETGPDACVIDCGGTMYHRGFYFHSNETHDSILQGITITNGYAQFRGGAIYCDSDASPRITNCIIERNKSYNDGGIFCISNAPIFTNCIIRDNDCESRGGGIGLSGSAVQFTHCTIQDNSAYVGGGVVCFGSSAAVFSFCTFSGNRASDRGGGIFLDMNTEVIMTNCQFENNDASGMGGAIYVDYYANPVIGGSEGSGNYFINNHAGAGADIGCLYFSPIEFYDASWNTFAGYALSDYYVSPQEAFILDNCTFQMTPIEQDVFVSPAGDDTNDGLTWDTAFKTIHHAVQVVYASDSNPLTIHVGPGLYSFSTTGERFTIPTVNHVTISGNSALTSILNAESTNRIFYIYHDDAAVIQHLTIQGGRSEDGGGIYFHYTQAQIYDCIFTSNYASDIGGAIYFGRNANPVLSNCIIFNNTAFRDGGGIFCDDGTSPVLLNCELADNVAKTGSGGAFCCCMFSDPVFDQCTISRNSASFVGGGIYLGAKAVTAAFTRCVISDNTSGSSGGGIYCGWSISADLSNSMVTGNISGNSGGGIYLSDDSSSVISNCTIADNSAITGGGIRGTASRHLSILNSILWGDNPDEIYGQISELIVTYSDIQGGLSGEGNIDLNPLFVTGLRGNYYLSHLATGHSFDSPCLDTGGDLSENTCYQASGQEFCMDTLTTRIDAVQDSEQADMGYHYPTSPEPTPTVIPCFNHGDVDFNGSHTAGDAQLAFMIALGSYTPSFEEECAADCNGDESVTAGDAQQIFHKVFGLEDCVDEITRCAITTLE